MSDLVRRLALSSGRAPRGDAARLIEERLRLLSGLGEEERAQGLAQRFADISGERAAWPSRIQRLLYRGDLSRACAEAENELLAEPPAEIAPLTLEIPVGDDPNAVPPQPDTTSMQSAPPPLSASQILARKLRALCYVAAEEPDAAQVAIDLLRAQGIEDAWFFTAVLSATGLGGEAKPIGDFSNGLNAATSVLAGLRAPSNVFDIVPPTALALLSENPEVPPAMRVEAATRGYERGQIAPADYRSFLRGFVGDTTVQAPALSYLRALADAEAGSDTETAWAIATRGFLQASAGQASSFRRAALFALPDIEALPPITEFGPDAVWFARAAAATGELGLAALWRAAAEPVPFEPAPTDLASEPFVVDPATGLLVPLPVTPPPAPPPQASPAALADLDGVLLVAGLAPDGEVSAQTPLNSLALASFLGAPLSAAERARLTGVSAAPARGASVPEGLLMRMTAAAIAGAQGETALLAAQAAGRQPETLPLRDLVTIMSALKEAGLPDDARALALDVVLAQRPPG
jgi:hypothetical protein